MSNPSVVPPLLKLLVDLFVFIMDTRLTIFPTPIWYRGTSIVSELPLSPQHGNQGGVCQRQHKRNVTTLKMKCQPRKVSLLSLSLCISTGVQLVADKTVGVIPGWAQLQLQLSSPCWPWVTRGFDDRLDLLCRSGLSRWGQQWMTMAGNIKPIEAGRQPYGVMGQTGQLSDECSCEHVDLLLCPFNSACHVSWCFLCLRIKTSLTFSTLEKSSKHRQQMYYATNSDCTAMTMTSIPTCTVL